MKLGMEEPTDFGAEEGDNVTNVTYEDGGGGSRSSKKFSNKLVIVIAIVVLAAIVILFSILSRSGGDKTPETSSNEQPFSRPTTETEMQEITEAVETEGFKPGAIDYEEGELKTPDHLDQSTDFLKDLNGVEIPVSYNVKSMDYVTDYVNYTKRRASMDDGMELYWLEVEYNGLRYRCTVPFWRYKAMSDSGICVVKIEVLTLEGGEKVISYMAVVDGIDS